MSNELTDQEVICTWMEAKPSNEEYMHPGKSSPRMWWFVFYPQEVGGGCDYGEPYWKPRLLTLDALWEVQERLTDEQWVEYWLAFSSKDGAAVPLGSARGYLHATPEQKITALAAVLRPALKAKEGSL